MQNKLQPWQTFSFFISSTFTDMDAERDYLRKIVFPRLNEYFAPRRVSLKIIDLRWGVNTNDFRDEQKAEERETQILKVCFDEIKRSRPFFIALLGDRYGWIPSDKQYNNILNKLSIADADLIRNSKGMSVTAMEILFGAIGNANLLERSLFFFRKADYTMLTPEQKKSFQDEAPAIKEKLSKLNAKIESV